MATRQQAIEYLKQLGYSSPDEQEIQTAMKSTEAGKLDAAGTSLKGTMEGTLETGGGVAPTGQERTLPTETPSNLSSFRSLLRKITEKYSTASAMTGLGATTGALGVKPEAISGRSLAGIVDFVKEQAKPKIADIYTSTIEMLDSQQKQAQTQLNTLISQKALSRLNDEQLAKLSSVSGMDFDYLNSLKEVQIEEEKKPKSFSIVKKEGRNVRVGFDDMGNIVSETDLGLAKKEGETIYTEKTIPPALRQDIIDTLTDKEGAKSLERELSLIDMIKLFPNVDRELLQDYRDQFYDYESMKKEIDIEERTMPENVGKLGKLGYNKYGEKSWFNFWDWE